MKTTVDFKPSCPVPLRKYPHVLLAHGGGGTLMHDLIDTLFIPTFQNGTPDLLHDSAVIPIGDRRIAFTTDSFVVSPLFFAGGDIGALSVHGTVNDLAMSGAKPLVISAAFVIEEGLPMDHLCKVTRSMKAAADQAGVAVVTGDTKVVDRGKGDGLFINTAGIGIIETDRVIGPGQVRTGDVLIVSGDVGRHGIAIMADREGLEFESRIESDSAAVADLTLALLDAGIEIHCMRDLTRGGLASALNEIASAAGVGIAIEECAVPVREDVRGACALLGFDPLYVACEGRFVCFIAPQYVERTLQIMGNHPLGQGACRIGGVTDSDHAVVSLKSRIGVNRVLDMMSGEQLPRIC